MATQEVSPRVDLQEKAGLLGTRSSGCCSRGSALRPAPFLLYGDVGIAPALLSFLRDSVPAAPPPAATPPKLTLRHPERIEKNGGNERGTFL